MAAIPLVHVEQEKSRRNGIGFESTKTPRQLPIVKPDETGNIISTFKSYTIKLKNSTIIATIMAFW
jgi:hypothetical protein